MLTPTDIFHALQVAVFGYVFSCLLMAEDQILEPWLDFLLWLETKAKWLAYPLGICEKCFTGQVALWLWLYLYGDLYKYSFLSSLISHLMFIAFSIFTVTLIKNLTEWTKKNY